MCENVFVGRQVVWYYVCGQTGGVTVSLWAQVVWQYVCGQTGVGVGLLADT